MSQEDVSRLFGAAFTAVVVAVVVGWVDDLHGNVVVLGILLFLAVMMIAFAFSLPQISTGRYLLSGTIAVLVVGIILGVRWIDLDRDLTQWAAFIQGFVLGSVPSAAGLAVGTSALLLYRRHGQSDATR